MVKNWQKSGDFVDKNLKNIWSRSKNIWSKVNFVGKKMAKNVIWPKIFVQLAKYFRGSRGLKPA